MQPVLDKAEQTFRATSVGLIWYRLKKHAFSCPVAQRTDVFLFFSPSRKHSIERV